MARPCWCVHGVRRTEWVLEEEDDPRDIFGFQVREGEPIFVNAFAREPLRSARVDSLHGLYLQENAGVQVVEQGQEEDYSLYEVITQRALRHFLSLWRRQTRRRACMLRGT